MVVKSKPTELSPLAGCGLVVAGMVFLAVLVCSLTDWDAPAPLGDPGYVSPAQRREVQEARDAYQAVDPVTKAQWELEGQRRYEEAVKRHQAEQ